MLARTAIFVVAHLAIVAATVAIGTASQGEQSQSIILAGDLGRF